MIGPALTVAFVCIAQTAATVRMVMSRSLAFMADPDLAASVNNLRRWHPWFVEARTASGRALLTLVVHAGDVRYQESSTRGDANRIDLSCGRLDIWAGPPLIGPMPGPGSPGDCVP